MLASRRNWIRRSLTAARLSARTAFKPVQIEDCIARALQPCADFHDLKRPISRAKISVHQFRNFFSAAWLLDLVQGSSHVFVEAIRTRNLAHLDSEANLLVGFIAAQCTWNVRTCYTELVGINWRISLRIASGSCSPVDPAKVYVRSKPFGPSTRISQFSLLCDPAIDTRHSPGLSMRVCSTLATISLDS